ncbi:glycoside hydrolase family 13 protein [Oscillospiraceae bacterium MB08-C2-2]|nr:glycoside hydrolase family 13 protein [Oscillospiraceae bacterium MB08-C2-2]
MSGPVIFDSRSPRYKRPFGALRAGEPVTVSFYLPKTAKVASPALVIYKADEWESPAAIIPMELSDVSLTENGYSGRLASQITGLYFYCFRLKMDGALCFISKGEGSQGMLTPQQGDLWQVTVYEEAGNPSKILGDGILYQVFPDRFYATDAAPGVPAGRRLHQSWEEMPDFRPDTEGEITNSDYFGGNLRGIEAKLPYLAELGVTALYLNPIFEAHSNHRYNTANYLRIDPLLGTEADFESLCANADKLGISVILDGVFSHTGSDSVYFNREGRYGQGGAYNDPDSPYREWYEFEVWPEKYDCWWGIKTLPNVRETSPSYLDFICGEKGVLAHWMSKGARGWRLDVADELPDDFLDALAAQVKAINPDTPVIGEVWENASNKISYSHRRRYLQGRQLDSVMNYPFREGIIDFLRRGTGPELLETILTVLEHYPRPVVDCLMNFLSTHDTPRAITALVGEEFHGQDREWQFAHHFLEAETYEKGLSLLRLGYLLLFGLPGKPCIYYGDEAGITGYRDPFNRTPFPWGHSQPELTRFFAALGGMRKQYAKSFSGDFIPLLFDENMVCFYWQSTTGRLLFAVNRGHTPQELPLAVNMLQSRVLLVTGQYENRSLAPLSGAVLWAMGEN